MRVLIVMNSLGAGGTEYSTASLLPALRERGVEAHVAILRSSGEEGTEGWVRDNGFPVTLLPPSWRRRQHALRSLIHATGADVVHSALFEADLVARLTRRRDVPLLTSLVNTSYGEEWFRSSSAPKTKLRVIQGIDLIGTRLSTHFHAVSRAVKEEAVRNLRIDPHRITVVRRGRRDLQAELRPGGAQALRTDLGIPQGATVLLNLGRQEPQKDHVTLVCAVAPLLKEDPGLYLVLAGRDGTASSRIREAVDRIPERNRIILIGHRSDVATVLDAADLFVTTSRYEGLPGVVIEAMSMGLPVVGSDIDPIREVLGDAPLAPPGRVQDFTRILREALRDSDWRRSCGAANRARFLRDFGLGQSADGMTALYGTLRRGRSDGGR